MSFPELHLELSEQARRDFRDILTYTLKTWGESQLVTYRNIIDSKLRSLAQDPRAGRDSIKPGLRVLAAGKHRIYFRTVDQTVYVVRILHERMDITQQLDKPDP